MTGTSGLSAELMMSLSPLGLCICFLRKGWRGRVGDALLGECDSQRLPLLCRYRIGPFEVESALIEHPAVVESAVVSSPDPVRGEVELECLSELAQQFHYPVPSMCLWQRPIQGYSLDSHHRVHVCRKSTSIPKRSGILWVAHDRQKHPSIQGSNSPKHSWDITETQSLLSASDPSRDFLPTRQLQAQASITHPYPTRKERVLLQLFQSHHIPSQCGSAIGVANWLDVDDMLVKGGKCW